MAGFLRKKTKPKPQTATTPVVVSSPKVLSSTRSQSHSPTTRKRPLDFDKPLPSPGDPVQGEYAHLWSMIVGEGQGSAEVGQGSTEVSQGSTAFGQGSALLVSAAAPIVQSPGPRPDMLSDRSPGLDEGSYENANRNVIEEQIQKPNPSDPNPYRSSNSSSRLPSSSASPSTQGANIITRAPDINNTMGTDISAPVASGVQALHRHKDREVLHHNTPPSAYQQSPQHQKPFRQRMSMQYPTPAPTPTSPRKSNSVRSTTAGKPLIFAAMAKVDQRPPPVVPPGSPSGVVYPQQQRPPSGVVYPQQQQQQRPPSASGVVHQQQQRPASGVVYPQQQQQQRPASASGVVQQRPASGVVYQQQRPGSGIVYQQQQQQRPGSAPTGPYSPQPGPGALPMRRDSFRPSQPPTPPSHHHHHQQQQPSPSPRRDSLHPSPPSTQPSISISRPPSFASLPRPNSRSQAQPQAQPHLPNPHRTPSASPPRPPPSIRTRRPSKAPVPAPNPTPNPVPTPRPSIDHPHTHVHTHKGLPTPPSSSTSHSRVKIGIVEGGDTLGVPLDEDPFAKVEGVRMLPASSGSSSGVGGAPSVVEGGNGNGAAGEEHSDSASNSNLNLNLRTSVGRSPMSSEDDVRRANGTGFNANVNVNGNRSTNGSVNGNRSTNGSVNGSTTQEQIQVPGPGPVPTSQGTVAPPHIPASASDPDRLTAFLSAPTLLQRLLGFFTFYDWCLILSLSREIRFMIVQSPELRETVLERFLRTVGYVRWSTGGVGDDPLSLSLQDLSDYMRGVSTPTHEYARIAALYNHSLYVHPSHRDPSLYETVRHLSASCRAYTRVVLRLRAQAEREVALVKARRAPTSRVPSPTLSSSNQSHGSVSGQQQHQHHQQQHQQPVRPTFQSPLFKLKRAPLLRVFVPSPDGDWLSDKSVLECEAECRRAGVLGLMRLGDVVWDVAVGDEGNVGRLVWDGSYLIDLDYTYSPIGDLPKYMPTLAFPPSYFHRVIRTGGPSSSNPVAHIDLRPWGEEIAANLQLLQDRVRTETPQGAYHNVVRWVHRSSFVIRPPARGQQRSPNPNLQPHAHAHAYPGPAARVPIPESGLFVDPGWYGTIVVETEGTNESLADLQDRCGPGAFPPRPAPVNGVKATDRESKLVFRILREKSRPGEIWIRAVSSKERLL